MPRGKQDHAITFRTILNPGDAGAVIALHGVEYAREHGFDHTFEAYVAGPLSRFIMNSNPREQIWIAERGGRLIGSIALVESDAAAGQLRWFLLKEEERGAGLGARMLDELIAFAREKGYARITLWTLDILPAALRLYRSRGFAFREDRTARLWGRDLVEQRYELELG